jgi:hypothetical protein
MRPELSLNQSGKGLRIVLIAVNSRMGGYGMTANVKVFGCRPHEGGAAHSGAGVRKPPREETAGRATLVVRRALWGFECRERCG